MKSFTVFMLLLAVVPGLRSQCLTDWDTSSTPGYGGVGTFYEAGQTVEICLSVNTWSAASANWFHGFEIILGPGWDATTITATGFPASCDGNGNWDQYASITSSATGATYGPGLYYDSGSGGPLDGDPGNNYGDFNSCPTPHWVQFCFEVTTLDASACIEGADLSITLNTLGDGEAGSWGSFNCNVDPNIVFSGPLLTCCEPPLFETVDPLCFGDPSGQITAVGNTAGPYNFTWSTGFTETTPDSSVLSGVPAGDYALVMVDGAGCSSTTDFTLTDPPETVFSLDSLVNVFCSGGSNGLLAVTASGGTGLGTFSYSLDGVTFQPIGLFGGLSAGLYTVTSRDASGCLVEYPVEIIEENLLFPLVDEVQDNLCYGDTTGSVTASAIGGYPPYSYSVDGVNYYAYNVIENLAAGTYALFVQDSDGCVVQTPFTVEEPVALTLDAGSYLPLPGGGSVELTPVTNATPVASWTWTPPTSLSCTNCENPMATPEFTTWYVLTVVDGSGCVVVDSTEIVVVRTLAIPNAFSPNGDLLNDLFIIRTPYVDQFLLRIYNRWGQEVFATNDINIGWDGTFSGKDQEVGTYLYYLDAVSSEGEEIRRTGSITLVR